MVPACSPLNALLAARLLHANEILVMCCRCALHVTSDE